VSAIPAVAEEAVPVPLRKTFDYALPSGLAPRPGARVLVPFGPRAVTGFVVGLKPAPDPAAPPLKDVLQVLDDHPAVSEDLLALCRWVADYYLAPLGEVLRAAVPAGIERGMDKRVSLTDEGRARLGILKGPEARVAALLARGPRPWREVVRHGALRLESMAKAGLVEITRAVSRARVRPRLEPWARLVRDPDAALLQALQRAPRQRAVLEALRGGEPRPVRELRDAHGDVGDALARLVDRGLVALEERDVLRDPFARAPATPHPPPPLTGEQGRALHPILQAIDRGGFHPFLLHGVTGSGKTEIYLRAIDRALAHGRQALVLVPEIALTPQLTARFRGRFGDEVAVLHSGLSDAERYDQWRRLRGELGGPVRIAVGARSAIFAPLDRLGILVVDEEHDPSFKQEETPRYNARDLALVRGQRAGAVVLLGSATPSMESLHNARQGKLRLLRLEGRVHARPMPRMEVVDLTRCEFVGHRSALLSRELAETVKETVASGEQAILFLNRRGYSSFVICRDCGKVFECRHCSVSLTHHRRAGRLLCHYCGYSEAVPKACPVCRSDRVGMMGVGTERVEDALRACLPAARVARLDRDAVTTRARLEGVLRAFASHEIDVLVGTQMVAKGHDFPGVTLVGVIFADQGLHFPDFRAAERTFQLLCQVAGRAGRGHKPGRVLVQTHSPGHPAIQAALRLDDEAFYAQEMAMRRALGYPPAGRLVALRFEGASAAAASEAAQAMGRRSRERLGRPPFAGKVGVLGPAEAPLARLQGQTRFQMLLRGPRGDLLRRFARELIPEPRTADIPRGVRVIVDVDPVNLL
jgi:primosomal protein N' (replication factor Y)